MLSTYTIGSSAIDHKLVTPWPHQPIEGTAVYNTRTHIKITSITTHSKKQYLFLKDLRSDESLLNEAISKPDPSTRHFVVCGGGGGTPP